MRNVRRDEPAAVSCALPRSDALSAALSAALSSALSAALSSARAAMYAAATIFWP